MCLQSFESYTVGCGGMSMGIIGILRVIGLHNNACNKMIPQNVALGSIAMYSTFHTVFNVFTSHRIRASFEKSAMQVAGLTDRSGGTAHGDSAVIVRTAL